MVAQKVAPRVVHQTICQQRLARLACQPFPFSEREFKRA